MDLKDLEEVNVHPGKYSIEENKEEDSEELELDYLKDDAFDDDIFGENQGKDKQDNDVKRKPSRSMTSTQPGP